MVYWRMESFSPRNGEVILKYLVVLMLKFQVSFSPRNGEVILKELDHNHHAKIYKVSVPAMGK